MFLHASNRSPRRAWGDLLDLPDARVAWMPGYDSEVAARFDQDRWEERLLTACRSGSTVVAHSFGGAVAMRAAVRRPDLVAALVLLEPAAYALGRGHEAVEEHIRRVQPVLDRASDRTAEEFAADFAAAMSGDRLTPPLGADALLAARRQRMLPGPWTLDTPSELDVPTLVVTGGWNDEYEVIAARIRGARHVTLVGHGHRPQDHPEVVDVVTDFLVR